MSGNGRLRNFLIILLVFFVFGSLAVFNISTFLAVRKLGATSGEISKNLVQLDDRVSSMGADINGARDMLGLPVHDFDPESQETASGDTETAGADKSESALFAEDSQFAAYAQGVELIIDRYNELRSSSEISADVRPLIAAFRTLPKDYKLVSSLKDKRLFIKIYPESRNQSHFDVMRHDGSVLCPVVLDYGTGTIYAGDRVCQNMAELNDTLLSVEKYFDIRTEAEKKTTQQMKQLEELVADSGFAEFLQNKGLSIGKKPVRNMECLDYPVADSEGRRTGYVSLNVDTGEVYFFDCDRVLITSLSTIKQNLVKKN